jgi:hypothetical protein
LTGKLPIQPIRKKRKKRIRPMNFAAYGNFAVSSIGRR